MKQDEFAFFNQQLAGMLREGIPLEGALKRLCQDMRRGRLRDELQALEADLARGTPLAEALKPRQLPELYKRMIGVGVKSGDLPSALTMLADHFHRQNNIWIRLKGLMVYPLIVLFSAFLISCFLAYILGTFIWDNLQTLVGRHPVPIISAALWMAPVVLGVLSTVALLALVFSPLREKLRWKLPAFREAGLAQIASAFALLLKNGVPFTDTIAVIQQLEQGSRAGNDLVRWQQRMGAGHGKFSDITKDETSPSRSVFPPLFIWTVAQAGEDLAGGFRRASELYQSRALYRIEMLLYSVLPCSVLALALMIVSQVVPVLATLTSFMQSLCSFGD